MIVKPIKITKKNRGKIPHPERGTDDLDPLDHIYQVYHWTDKLKYNIDIVPISKEDELNAYRELASDEIKEKVLLLANEYKIKRLG